MSMSLQHRVFFIRLEDYPARKLTLKTELLSIKHED